MKNYLNTKRISLIIFLGFAIFSSFAQNKASQKSEETQKDYIHLIMYGQSLSAGHDSRAVLSSENIAGNYMIGDQIWINYGNSNFTSFNPLLGKPAIERPVIMECPLLGAANHIRLKGLHENIIATSAGFSGESIEGLSKESEVTTHYQNYIKTLNSAKSITKRSESSISCPALFWMQGESNYRNTGSGMTAGAISTSDKDEYKSLMIKLKNNMQADAKSIYQQFEDPTFIMYHVGVQYTRGKELTIGMAQLEASNEYDDIICAGPVYQMTDVGGHLDGNGYRWFGEMLGKVYYKTKILGEDFKPLQPLELSRDANNKKKVIIKFLVPKMPLVLDENTLPKATNYGFEVYNNNAKQIIYDINVVDDCVIITCTRDLTGKVEVVYAGANVSPVGHGNLRDSDNYEAFFTYQDLDKKDANGNYIYPRNTDNTSATLRPQSEPKDDSGSIIYDKPYPLYNFSVAFYYAIEKGEDKFTVPNLSKGNTGLNNLKADDEIYISHADGKVSVYAPRQNNLTIEVFDISGKLITKVKEKSDSVEFESSLMRNEVYILKVHTTAKVKTQKLILKHN